LINSAFDALSKDLPPQKLAFNPSVPNKNKTEGELLPN